MPLELGGNAIGHRYGATGASALGRRVLAAGVAAPDTDQAGAPVDVAPAQRGQLALAEPCHGGGEPEHAIGRTEKVVGRGTQQRLELLAVEEMDVGIGRRRRRPVDHRDGLIVDPPALEREREHAMGEVEVVGDRLDRETVSPLGGDVRSDVARRELGDVGRAEVRAEMPPSMIR